MLAEEGLKVGKVAGSKGTTPENWGAILGGRVPSTAKKHAYLKGFILGSGPVELITGLRLPPSLRLHPDSRHPISSDLSETEII
jgi:hypothetical protein